MLPSEAERLAPTARPDDRPVGFQRWRQLLFLHWPVPAEAIAAKLPAGLELDTFDGRAWIGVVPFTMRDVVPWWAPPLPGISHFHELNVRTYVHRGGRNPGVYFFSLDAAASIAVLAARAGWGLPYHRARMQMTMNGDQIRYRSRRLWPGPKPAELEVDYRVGAPLGPAAPGTLEHFLAERYLLHVARGERLLVGQVHHRPYPLQHAEVTHLRESMVCVQGLPGPEGPPHALFAAGVDVDVYRLRPL
ncbi:MAG: DUF2071 domain-containing protein [Polyangiaceae bacterium]